MDFGSGDSDLSDEEVVEQQDVKCLFCKDLIDSVESAIAHCKSVHQFDFKNIAKKFNMDCYSFIKFVNFIRKTDTFPEEILDLKFPSWSDDSYLQPVLEFDPWLMFDFEDYLQSNDCNGHVADVQSFEDQIQELQSALRQKDGQIEELMDRVEKMKGFVQNLLKEDDTDADIVKISNSVSSDGSYFESYSHPGIHFDMLADEIRTVSYKNAIMLNKSDFVDKIVLDLGCGTGILSMFAVSAGAERVIAIDNSEIITYTLDIIRENQMNHKIDVIKSQLENITLPYATVDVIVSEWMGYFLLFEGMLDSLIYARDKYLKSGGVLVPDQCDMFICGASDSEGLKNNSSFWSDVFGYRMSSIQNEMMKQAVVDVIPIDKIFTSCDRIASFNLYTCTLADTTFESGFEIVAMEDAILTTLVGYFDVSFNLEHRVHFSTSPLASTTHWKQTLFHIYEPIPLKQREKLRGTLKCERNDKNKRFLKVTIIINGKRYIYNVE